MHYGQNKTMSTFFDPCLLFHTFFRIYSRYKSNFKPENDKKALKRIRTKILRCIRSKLKDEQANDLIEIGENEITKSIDGAISKNEKLKRL